jgi:hypothetical protein
MEMQMSTGMLWFDNDPKLDLPAKIKRATEYYQKKYGQKPDLCFVNPSAVSDRAPKGTGVEVQTNQMILPNHFWLGMKLSPQG